MLRVSQKFSVGCLLLRLHLQYLLHDFGNRIMVKHAASAGVLVSLRQISH